MKCPECGSEMKFYSGIMGGPAKHYCLQCGYEEKVNR